MADFNKAFNYISKFKNYNFQKKQLNNLWNKYFYNEICDQNIANRILYLNVNLSASHAHKILQLVLKKRGFKIEINGLITKDIIAMLNGLIHGIVSCFLLDAIIIEAFKYYIKNDFKYLGFFLDDLILF